MSTTQITAGFLPLTDSAILIAAHECGFTENEGINLRLMRETSWANIRDRMAIGQFNAAHMLAPMPVAAALNLSQLKLDIIAPMALGLGGNAITVSARLWQTINAQHPIDPLNPRSAGHAIKEVVEERKAKHQAPLQFAVVHPHSVHNYELRYWLASIGVHPDSDVEIVIVPPPFMPDALKAQQIDGFCVGEPWNSVAVAAGHGHIATIKSAIWKSSPEKVLGIRRDWALANTESVNKLLRALYGAAQWCSKPANVVGLSHILARPDYLNKPADLILRGLAGTILGNDRDEQLESFFQPFEGGATFPWQSHALWFYSQMVRWGQVEHQPGNIEIARQSFRPDIYRSALEPLGIPVPGANAKVEGALQIKTPVGASKGELFLGPDGFFDDAIFDPDQIELYIANQSNE